MNLMPSRRAALFTSVAVATAAGALAGWLEPRGPATQAQALLSIAGAAAVGLAAGGLSRSRWSILLAPVAFAAGFELVRLGVLRTSGPTVDAVQPGSMYGLIALVVGRGVSAALLLWPIAVGAGIGAGFASRRRGAEGPRIGPAGGAVAVVAALTLVGLAVVFAQPAWTAPIEGPDGTPRRGSIAELARVPLGGGEQVVMLRGRNVDHPVLLYLAGGPGGTDLGAMRGDTGLEADFVVATWDQRGTGKSYAAIEPAATFTLDQMVADTLELTDWLRERFGQQRIYLVGNSWGSLLGALAVRQAPDRFAAFVGTGQMVDIPETDRMFWEDTLAWARRTGDAGLVTTLEANGPPPYPVDRLLDYEAALSHEHDWNPYPELDLDREMPAILFVPEHDLMDRINGFRGLLDTLAALYPQLQDVDLRVAVPSLDVPVYLVLGTHETRGRAVPARDWFERLDAPAKRLVVFEHSGHRPQFEEPAAFAALMRRVVAETGAKAATEP
jgi:pimeloyl-ACP methyl ester carboxylesterase